MMDKSQTRILMRGFLVEMIVYGALVVVYFLIVLQFLGDWLAQLFQDQRIVYALIGLGLIVGQGVLLSGVTSFLLSRLRLDRLE